MTRLARFLLLAIAVFGLSACGSTRQAVNTHIVPDANRVIDPDDSVFRAAVQSYLAQTHQPQSSQYEYVRQDLDGDGRRDAIVMFTSPFYSWCSIDGCRMVILKASNTNFSYISQIDNVRGPLLVSNTRTYGWRDLIVRLSGREDVVSKDVDVKFNGRTYPSQIAALPPIPSVVAMADINGTQIFP